MNKSELIAEIASRADLSKAQAERAANATFEVIREQLAAGESVTIVGFGTFETRRRAATTGRNPRTGETIKIAAANQPKFKPGKALKEAVN